MTSKSSYSESQTYIIIQVKTEINTERLVYNLELQKNTCQICLGMSYLLIIQIYPYVQVKN